mmetsp:Transcript_49313/g.97537  ORF Transcript_49313/g.97537 Transcript_49313/m.97537 type:complete len:82 (-) Transcript_49313:13-258(-)
MYKFLRLIPTPARVNIPAVGIFVTLGTIMWGIPFGSNGQSALRDMLENAKTLKLIGADNNAARRNILTLNYDVENMTDSSK